MVGQIQKRQDQKQYLQAIPTRATRGIYKRNSLRYKIADKKKGGSRRRQRFCLAGSFLAVLPSNRRPSQGSSSYRCLTGFGRLKSTRVLLFLRCLKAGYPGFAQMLFYTCFALAPKKKIVRVVFRAHLGA